MKAPVLGLYGEADTGIPVAQVEALKAALAAAHKTAEFSHLAWGISQARRAWVTASDIVNTRSRADLLAWVAGKPARV